MKKAVVVLAISLLLGMATVVYAQGHGMMGEGSEMGLGLMWRGSGMMGDPPVFNGLVKLGLDERQKEETKQIVRTTMKETIKKIADLDIARIDLRDLLDKDAVDMKAVESKLKHIASLENDIILLRLKAYEEIKSKLTPDQRTKLREMIERGSMMEHMGMMQGKGCGMMGGPMQHGNMETVSPAPEKGEEMPGMEHGH